MARNIAIVFAALLVGLVLVQPVVWDWLAPHIDHAQQFARGD